MAEIETKEILRERDPKNLLKLLLDIRLEHYEKGKELAIACATANKPEAKIKEQEVKKYEDYMETILDVYNEKIDYLLKISMEDVIR